jgi:hypothetical protein
MMMGDLEKHASIWDSTSRFISGGMSGGPLISFNLTQNGQGDGILISPFSQFLSTSLSVNKRVLEYAFLGSIQSIPINTTNSLILFYSSSGINKVVEEWGQIMQKTFHRTEEYRLNDLTINYLRYYTDKGNNYEQTIIKIKENLTIPIDYIQLDSWWYYKGLGDGVKQWISRPDIFTDGLEK